MGGPHVNMGAFVRLFKENREPKEIAKELGITLPDEKVEAVAEKIRSETFWRKRKLQAEDFLRIVDEVSG